jgi:hypothetical protein
MTRIALIAAAAVIATTSAASAYDWRGDRIDARESNQAYRIHRASRNGELTWSEKIRLWGEQARIHRMERRAYRDGYVSRHEAREIERAQDAASRHIRHESRDGQTAWWRRWF